MNESILKALFENEEAGNIPISDVYVLIGLIDILYDHLYGEVKEFQEEGVRNMLADKLYVKYEKEIEEAAKEAAKEATKELARKLENVAKNLLTKGLSPEDIAEATKLPIEKVRELQMHEASAG